MRTVPPVWWGWWDQSKYLEAAKAFAVGDFAIEHHWYPAGYSLLAAPFVSIFPDDPFVVVDLLCLVASMFALMRLASIFELPECVGIFVFLATTVFNTTILRHYALPWTSTPTSCLLLWGTYLCLCEPKPSNSLLLGLIVGGVLLIKPIDVVGLAPTGIFYLGQIARSNDRPDRWRRCAVNVLFGLVTFGCVALVALLLHWLIYGWRLSPYEAMTTSQRVFIFEQFPQRFYDIFINPDVLHPNAPDTQGLIDRFPWLVLAFGGMVYSLRKAKIAAISAAVWTYLVFYVSYYDLNSTNLWRFNLVHYFTWMFPVMGLYVGHLLKQVSGLTAAKIMNFAAKIEH